MMNITIRRLERRNLLHQPRSHLKTETAKTLLAWILAILTVAVPFYLADQYGQSWALAVPIIAFIWAGISRWRDKSHIRPMDRH